MTAGAAGEGSAAGGREARHSSADPVLIRGARVVRGEAGPLEAADVLLAGGRIDAVGKGLSAPPGAATVDAAGLWLAPGWIDIQVNDIDWIARGRKEPSEHAARVRRVLRHQAAGGVTGLVLATLAAPIEDILAYLRGMAEVLEAARGAGAGDRGGGDPIDRAFIGGLVEGTFMNPALSGAHNPAWIHEPRRDLLDSLLDTGAVKLINIAPEASPGAIDLIRHAASRGAVVGAGHAKPHAERLREAVAAGLRYIIHLGNGPTGSSLKAFHDGGMLEESLRNDGLIASIIMDGIHIHPALVRDWIARKGLSRVIGTSDAAFALDPPRGGFEVLGIEGRVSEDGRWLRVVPPLGTPAPNPLSSDFAPLFGSAAAMRDVFENALGWLTREMAGVYTRSHPAMPLDEALRAASLFCSANPASLLGLGDRGSIEAGKRADVVLLEIGGGPGDHSVRVRETWVA
jgi:N-acetylglucosamine-6-phosphate deacetylase